MLYICTGLCYDPPAGGGVYVPGFVNFRMDEEDKKGMEEVCKELGLSMTTAFTLLAKRCGGKDASLLKSRLILSTLTRISAICIVLPLK